MPSGRPGPENEPKKRIQRGVRKPSVYAGSQRSCLGKPRQCLILKRHFWHEKQGDPNLADLVRIVTDLEGRGVGFVSLTEQINTTSSSGKLVFHLFASLAEFERNLIKERTQAGLKAARARGRVGGRPGKLTGKDLAMAKSLMADRTNDVGEIAKRFNVHRSTLYRLSKFER